MKAEQNTFLNKKTVFNKIYHQNWKALYAFAFNILRDKVSAEDIIQEIFIDFWVRMNDTEIQNYTAYLFQAVRNQCAKNLRNKKLTAFELEVLEESLQLIEEQEFAEFPKERLAEHVREKAHEILPPKCLDIFNLRFYENMSIKEIAEYKKISVSTVENQINKALKMLKTENDYYIKLLAILIFCS
ncbi:RNA polymerase sigma factor [Flavobacterium salmonis]|uniref:RNA polymerase sigma-70 factor n=1 Tax=Flavobacterium salmonis TaxID=2654844 RepID=A0A6V6Z692_9FLAO|nr:sigma-70 family RNA polymerase sigma factor [Flavobacterium salmonis]CAD0007165.1 RNA polymerase sigma-70 factor [Flavobacterium salmonis]